MAKQDYPPVIAALLDPPRLMELGPGSPNRAAAERLRTLSVDDLGGPIRDRNAARACLSGLWLLHDFLDESHAISQDIHDPTGSYWHAIMHRREPDPSNSKYWFRKVGSHPVLPLLSEACLSEGLVYINPFDFVDLCERVRGTGSDEESRARRIQELEWRTLFDWCLRQATKMGDGNVTPLDARA